MVFPLQLHVLYRGQTIKFVVGVMAQPLHAWLKDFFRDGLVVTALDFQSRGPVFRMSEVWPDSYNEGYTHQLWPEPTHKIHLQQQKHWV